MALTLVNPVISTDPGYLLIAPLGTAEPTSTVVGSVFTDDWTTWVPLSQTDAGSVFNFQTTTEPIESAETLEPLKYVSTGRSASLSFALINITAAQFKYAMNGGTTTVSGSTTTTKTVFTPPTLGQEVRVMLGWESQDHTERLIGYQCFNSGQISMARGKGAAKTLLNCEFGFEAPTAGGPLFKYITAGVARG